MLPDVSCVLTELAVFNFINRHAIRYKFILILNLKRISQL